MRRYGGTMEVRPRSLVSNSIGSVVASGTLIFSTILIPAILSRALSRAEYDLYSIVLAALPLMMILPQSIRTVGASQLALAVARHGSAIAVGAYRRFTLVMSVVHVALIAIGLELYVSVGQQQLETALIRSGEYAVLIYTLGLMAVGLKVAPAAAQRNFLPDNVAKVWPGLFQLIGIAGVWIAHPTSPLRWIFAIMAASSWSIATVLLAWGPSLTAARDKATTDPGLIPGFARGLGGVLWWNVTAYLATTATVMVVAIGFAEDIVPFGIATSLLGVIAAAPIAISGPIAVHAAAMRDGDPAARRHFFLLVNTLFQIYIGISAVVIAVAPTALYALWLTPALAGEVKTFSVLLLPATVIRLLTMNFTIFVMSAGRQHSLWLSPMVEAVMSIGGSIVLGWAMGIAGIPLALTLSATVRLLLTMFHDEPLNRDTLALLQGDVLLSAWRLARRPAC